jgi:tripartite-type tricarboxylate transporter receptor subunit TctC
MKLLKILATAVAAGLLASSPAIAQNNATGYPNKPVKLICPFPPGGAADNIARAAAAALEKAWSQPVVVENKPGAGGMIGAETAARASGDPYTLFLGSIGVMTVNQHIQKDIRYDATKDFTPLSMLIKMPSFLVVNQTVPANNVKEFISYAKANPGKLSYGSAGNGTTEHTNAVMLASMTGLDMVHVPYKGIAPSITDLIGGQINFIIELSVAILPMIKANKVKVLGVTSAQRSPLLPNVPTLAETVPGFEAYAWYALYAPAGIPKAIQQQINGELVKHFNAADNKARFAEIGAEVSTSTPEALASFQTAEIARWGNIVKAAGIKRD